jgi:hypothetical protein
MATSIRDLFLELIAPGNFFGGNKDFTIPLDSQWALFIHDFPSVIQRISEFETTTSTVGGEGNGDWNLSQEKYNALVGGRVHTTYPMGCYFVDSVSVPGESYSLQTADLTNNNGFLEGAVAGKRTDLASRNFTTSFRETDLDFIEGIIRPWIIMASYYGLFAYNNTNLRVKIPRIQVINFSKNRAGPRQFTGAGQLNGVNASQQGIIPDDRDRPVRKIYNFYGCVPHSVDVKRLSYAPVSDAGSLIRSVGWSFDNMTVQYGV